MCILGSYAAGGFTSDYARHHLCDSTCLDRCDYSMVEARGSIGLEVEAGRVQRRAPGVLGTEVGKAAINVIGKAPLQCNRQASSCEVTSLS